MWCLGRKELALAASGATRIGRRGSTSASASTSSIPVLSPPSRDAPGLFGIAGLHDPRDWEWIADECIRTSSRLVDAASSAPPDSGAVRALDDLSDAVCRVADAAELCRVAAASPSWRRAAGAAAEKLGSHVHGLNAHRGMASALSAAMRNGRDGESFTREASRVGAALLRDFSRSGMFLSSPAARAAAARAEADAALAAVRYGDALADPDAGGVRFFYSSNSRSPVAATPAAVASALRHDPCPDARRACYEAAYSKNTTRHLTEPLREMLDARARRADALGLGERGWRGMVIDDDEDLDDGGVALTQASLAGDSERVRSFLLGLAEELRPKAQEQARKLQRAKDRSSGGSGPSLLQPWDVAFFSSRVRAEAAAEAASAASGGLRSSSSTSVGVEGAVGGFLDVLEAAVGVRLERAPLGDGEGWADGVAKFVAVDVGGRPSSPPLSLGSFPPSSVLGNVYLDLAPRPAKYPGAAHFTLRCGRDLGGGRGFARPAVAIVASFAGLREKKSNSSSSSPTPPPLPWSGSLSWQEATTLLHEGGHALHSLLSRTEFQHLSGTRGPLDVVEVPSHVAERWARLSLCPSSSGRSDLLSSGAAAASLATRGGVGPVDFAAAEAARRSTGALDFLQQVVDALVDLELHRGNEGGKAFDAAEAARDAAELAAELLPVPLLPTASTSSFEPHARFSHLSGYGGAYYSYVYAECVAADACARSARGRSDAGDGATAEEETRRALRAAGEALRESLLRHGCSAPPREAVEELLERSGGGGGGGGGEGGGGKKRGWAPDASARLAEVC